MSNYILVINPGSTSTKIGVFENDTLLFDKTLRHPAEEIAKFATIPDQKSWRKELVEQALIENNFDMKKLTAICARGGLGKPIRGGTYATSDALLADCVAGVQGQHACNLGGLIAREIGDELGIPSFIADPPRGGRAAGHCPLFRPSPDPAGQQVPRPEPEGRGQTLRQGGGQEV